MGQCCSVLSSVRENILNNVKKNSFFKKKSDRFFNDFKKQSLTLINWLKIAFSYSLILTYKGMYFKVKRSLA